MKPFVKVIAMMWMTILAGGSSAQEVILDTGGFETEMKGKPPAHWQPFHHGSKPDVKVWQSGAYGSRHSVRVQRSSSGGWTSLSRPCVEAQERVMIEFSFAFGKTDGRSLNVWTHEPGGIDASQLNLCIEGSMLMQFDGRTRTWEEITEVQPTLDLATPAWHRLRVIVDSKKPGLDYWISQPNSRELPELPITRHAYRTNLPIGAIDLVSGTRVAPGAWYLIDDLVITGGEDLPSPHEIVPIPDPITLWTGPPIPKDVEEIPFVEGMQHQTIHQANPDGYKFLHGAAIINHQGVLHANWANSPTHENGPHETMQGRRSTDGGKTWSDVEMIAAGFDGPQRHSHGVLLVHKDQLWTIAARFGVGAPARRFPGLSGEAFVFDDQANHWESRGMVMENCWPYDEPLAMSDGNLITGGQDKDGLPVVAISHGDDLTSWDTVSIPFDRRLKPSFAETTVWAEGKQVIALIRGGEGVAWVATSDDHGRSWSRAGPSNMPMPRAKAYLGKLSTGQLYLLSNLHSRDTLVVSVSKPHEQTLSRMWKIRHGKSIPPRYQGHAKSKQWSYPYGHEHDGKLYVVYSIGKEDCGLSIIPIKSLH